MLIRKISYRRDRFEFLNQNYFTEIEFVNIINDANKFEKILLWIIVQLEKKLLGNIKEIMALHLIRNSEIEGGETPKSRRVNKIWTKMWRKI